MTRSPLRVVSAVPAGTPVQLAFGNAGKAGQDRSDGGAGELDGEAEGDGELCPPVDGLVLGAAGFPGVLLGCAPGLGAAGDGLVL
jgi:hypothetical protein